MWPAAEKRLMMDGWIKIVNEKITSFRILVEKSMCYTCDSRCLFPHQTVQRRRHVDGFLLLFCKRYSAPPFVNLGDKRCKTLVLNKLLRAFLALLLTCWLNFLVLLFSRLASRSSFSSSIFSSVSHNSSARFST